MSDLNEWDVGVCGGWMDSNYLEHVPIFQESIPHLHIFP
jgi:hypothetical protein